MTVGSEVFGDWMYLLLDIAVDLAKGGWGGRVYLNSFIHAIPLLSMTKEARKSLDKISRFC
ncbi:unnamed protein product [Clonostachys rhizophaga]|uniref:Uncharacterized protein n=1 Tax=Clonostachys rhizophaga TaxID=160324 RepID=A0A9N9VNA9_9HYPO|nr:unnamed protein product [Clonostachys rhizophaga]